MWNASGWRPGTQERIVRRCPYVPIRASPFRPAFLSEKIKKFDRGSKRMLFECFCVFPVECMCKVCAACPYKESGASKVIKRWFAIGGLRSHDLRLDFAGYKRFKTDIILGVKKGGASQ